ncbi:hypothetical protein MAPG_00238 [Magnaporthiopsis poae ATCC 64411]|uniref:Uncharacterized protein n=1 Tax=Magnaporthiopsis poae (strain ATCC 64411 / 73-15) TaxID=644358 RepID=A0A0C4DKG6_MAGP6|nr:hypothetical protein MAPG_00238 [Magnaporthiopsis poae ATCC 64411]
MPSSESTGGRTAAREFYATPPGAQGYHIPQDTTWRDPQNRKMRVLTIGAGVSGIMMAYLLQKECQNVEHVIYEKNADIGGTWLENRYPYAACDVPSHAYTFQFALYPDWPRFFSQSAEIWTYLDLVCNTFDLRKYMTFHTKVTGCYWQQDKGQWLVKLRQQLPGQEAREFEEHCDLLLYGTGLLNAWKWPDVPGLHDRFKGRVVHTAEWPDDYTKEQWKDERVAVIGSGASSLQTVPGMQPYTKHIDIFVRTGAWFTVIAGNTGDPSKLYTDEERAKFHADPAALLAHAKSIEDEINSLWGGGCPESYLGLAVPDLPNFITFIGPTWPVQNGSLMGPLQSVGYYAVQIVRKMQNEGLRSWTPRADVTDSFNRHVQEWVKYTVYTDDCRSWYKNNETGRVNAIWPGSSLHYQQVVETPRYEDFEIEYWAENRWAMLGMGFTMPERKKEGADLSPYLKLENIDPKWLKEVILGDKSARSEEEKGGDDKKGTNGDSTKEASNGQSAKI